MFNSKKEAERKRKKGIKRRNDSCNEGFATLWVAMAMVVATLLPLLLLFPYLH
jgi:hypothetical protein